MNTLVATVVTGIGATLLMDLWSVLRRSLFGVATPDYALVGRWLGHMTQGQFVHAAIKTAPHVQREALIGWTAHYLTGIAYAAMLVALAGTSWLRQPAPMPALLFGLVSVAAPFLLMQPGMGAGIAASRTPNPRTARLHSLVTHAVFGLGLYVAAWLVSRVYS